jgi:ethanolamine utilization protein EutN
VAVDTVGAGDGELVLVAQGSAAREAIRTPGPIDAAIVAILDSLTVGGKRTYTR